MSGCGCNGGGCGSRQREALTLSSAVLQAALKNLFTVAATGIKHFPWPTEEIAELADLIAKLLAENERLKRLLNPQDPAQPLVVVTGDRVCLKLGPGGAYTLDIPAGTHEQRKELAQQLAAAVAALQCAPRAKAALPGQIPLPFNQ